MKKYACLLTMLIVAIVTTPAFVPQDDDYSTDDATMEELALEVDMLNNMDAEENVLCSEPAVYVCPAVETDVNY